MGHSVYVVNSDSLLAEIGDEDDMEELCEVRPPQSCSYELFLAQTMTIGLKLVALHEGVGM